MKRFSVAFGFFAVFVGAFMIGTLFFPNTAPVQTATQIVEAPVRAVEHIFIPDPLRVFGKDHVRVLIVGLDYDYDKLDQETSKSARSDLIMAVNLDFKNHRISELSIPRDMVAVMPDGQKAKINQAQSEGGVKKAQTVVADWLGIPSFDRYVVLRINTAKDMIDAIGGIDVNVQNSSALRKVGSNGPLNYDDNWGHLHVHLKPGVQHLDGSHAVGYARFRHDWCGDPCRIMRQQQVLHAVVDSLEHEGVNSLNNARRLLEVVRKDIDTDFTFQEELASVLAFDHLTSHDVRTAQVPYIADVMLPGYGSSIIADEEQKRKLVNNLLLAPEEVGLGPAPPSPAVASSPNGIRVRIENGTDFPGAGERIATRLRMRGFTVTNIADADNHDVALTLIESLPENTSALKRVHAVLVPTLPGARIWNQSNTADDASDVTVVLGKDALNVVP